ncbi:MAG TPA: glycosyltransferase, partial [Pyrinomonadaceae bacterium]|nr:glycosyltransferase [Pyrinomonadaceae bacterium]
VPLGIDLQPFADWRAKRNILREEIGATEDEVLVGLVGRLTEVKNHSLFLQAAKIYQKKSELPKLKFVVIGDGHLREKLEREAETLGVKDTVVFLGNRNDADVFYAGLDIVALTSLNEGTPLSLIEAMANEKAVVSTAVGGVVDLLGNVVEQKQSFQLCERGVSVSSGNAEDFYSGLMYLVNDVKMRQTLSANGKSFIEDRYGKERLVTDVKNLYRKITGN